MTNNQQLPIKVFISYSHDTPAHKGSVLALANRLRDEGIDTDIDQYQLSPPAGWPAWMATSLRKSDFVIVVCTETYCRRASGDEVPGKGLGATWEGAIITNAIYQNGFKNEKFIPVVLDSADTKHIPYFLESSTYYNLGYVDGYDQLYRHITGQAAVVKPTLGQLRRLDPVEAPTTFSAPQPTTPSLNNSDPLCLILSESGGYFLFYVLSLSSKKDLVANLRPVRTTDFRFLETIGQGASMTLAYQRSVRSGSVTDVEHSITKDGEQFCLTLRIEDSPYNFFSEASFNGISSDTQAELRARRILLNETLEQAGHASKDGFGQTMLEHFVQGPIDHGLKVKGSPLPELYSDLGKDVSIFPEAARLLAMVVLAKTSTVAIVDRLTISMDSPSIASIDFQGTRPQRYTNQEPHVITVNGKLNLL